MNDTPDTEMTAPIEYASVVVTIIGHNIVGEYAIMSTPFWELERTAIATNVQAMIVAFCNQYGTGNYTVTMTEINT